tara:strand:- start:697 stop:1056 length:360 start_codon:yes stop_codon:yes gene_type:complete
MTKLSEENKEQLKKIFHCVNFLIFLKQFGEKLDDQQRYKIDQFEYNRQGTLDLHAKFQQGLEAYLDIFNKDKSFDKKTMNLFLDFYKTLESCYKKHFEKPSGGKAFHIMFDHSPNTKDE